MSSPHRETILDSVLAELRKIKRQAGYNYDVTRVSRYSRHRDEQDEDDIEAAQSTATELVVEWTGEDLDSRRSAPTTYAVETRYRVVGTVRRQAEALRSSDETVSLFVHDVVQALATGLDLAALSADIPRMEIETTHAQDGDDPGDGFVMGISFEYTVEGDDTSTLA